MKKFILVFLFLSSCAHVRSQSSAPVNSAWAMAQPYVIFVSIDGYRYDYTDLFHPKALTKLRDEGVSSESLIPIYPSKTFASHFSMITGLTAEHSGISANEFYDPYRHEIFSSGDEKSKSDGSWYLGHTLWEVAAAKNMLSAAYFWVSSDVQVHHTQPTYWIPYDDSVPNAKRVEQVLKWLALAPEKRPHLVNLYFSNVDRAGHFFGAGSDEVKKQILELDDNLAELMKGVVLLRAAGLPVNVIVVSDHGMDNVNSKYEYIDDEADLSSFIVSSHGPEMQMTLKEGADRALISKTLNTLRSKAQHYKVFMRDEVPAELHYRDSNRIGDLVLVVDEPYWVETHALQKAKSTIGNHGWDARKYEKMRGIFYADGPQFKSQLKIAAFENFNVYSVVTHLLSLDNLGPVDSQLGDRARIFR